MRSSCRRKLCRRHSPLVVSLKDYINPWSRLGFFLAAASCVCAFDETPSLRLSTKHDELISGNPVLLRLELDNPAPGKTLDMPDTALNPASDRTSIWIKYPQPILAAPFLSLQGHEQVQYLECILLAKRALSPEPKELTAMGIEDRVKTLEKLNVMPAQETPLLYAQAVVRVKTFIKVVPAGTKLKRAVWVFTDVVRRRHAFGCLGNYEIRAKLRLSDASVLVSNTLKVTVSAENIVDDGLSHEYSRLQTHDLADQIADLEAISNASSESVYKKFAALALLCIQAGHSWIHGATT